MLSRVVASAVVVLALGACAVRPPEPPPGQANIAPHVILALPKPGDLGRRVEAAQLVTARYGDQTFIFEGHLSAGRDGFVLVGLDSLGRKALTITWTDAGVSYDAAPWLPNTLRPANMLADIVLLYWPEAAVRNALAGGTLTTAPHSRSVVVDGKEILHADYQLANGDDPWTGRLSYRNLAWGYQLDIQSAEVTP